MNLLSDAEIDACLSNPSMHIQARIIYRDFARAIEAAILAKLASAELPEPAGKLRSDEFDGHVFEPSLDWPFGDLYTATQLHEAHAQGFAAGAAEQLSAEPVAFTDADFMGIFVSKDIAQDCGATIELYTRREA